MGEINIPEEEKNRLKDIDADEMDRLIDLASQEERLGDLGRLARCGPYIADHLRYFEKAIGNHRLAKSPRKREETAESLRRAGRDLSFAVRATKRRMETEEKEGQYFCIDDRIAPPYRFGKHINVTVRYRWRRAVNEEWKCGSIMFTHEYDPRPDYTIPQPKRKPSAAKREEELQRELYKTWEHLKRGALYSVRDYFREGGDGNAIPKCFQATVDSYTRDLNNFSTQFWRQRP